MQASVSDLIGRQWIESTRTVPTRALQLAMETSQDSYERIDDSSIVLSILKNNPSTVPPDLFEKVHSMARFAASSKAALVASRNGGHNFSQTIDPLRRVLDKYLFEKSQGLHQYASAEDCSLTLISDWIESRKNDPVTKRYAKSDSFSIVALGHSDYLRLAARAIEEIPSRAWQSGLSRAGSTLGAALGGQKEFGQKAAAKLFKRLSSRAHLQNAPVPEHQDMVLLLSGDRIRIRPVSFTQEASWKITKEGTSTRGSIFNLLEDQSPVHNGRDPLEEFESLLNSVNAAEEDFQRFFERFPRFLLGTDYDRVISQPILVREDEHDLIPDFVMVPHGFGRPAILDLKLPNVSLARHKTNRVGFLQSVMEARDQLLEYRNYFSSKTASEEARKRFGCDLYLPRISVVIGRTSSFADDYERRKIESRVPDIDVITYDDIWHRARQCRTLGLL